MGWLLLGEIVVLVALEMFDGGLHDGRVVVEGARADLLDIED